MMKLMVFNSETSEFFLLARKGDNYEEAYLNTLTNNLRRLTPSKGKKPFPDKKIFN